jgi:hydroxymethylglutaryl-CoA reductase
MTAKALTAPCERRSSRIPGFYRLDVHDRHRELATRFDLTARDLNLLLGVGMDGVAIADKMVENCVGVLCVPVGLGLNFQVNGRDYVVPMAVEEPSVVAAASNSARLVRASGGFRADAGDSLMIAQVQVLAIDDPRRACTALEGAADRILAAANHRHSNMVARGGGAKYLEVRQLESEPAMLAVHLLVDCKNAMGANIVNDMAEAVAPIIEEVSGGRVRLRILSNLADRRLARAYCAIREDLLERPEHDGAEVAKGVVEAYLFAAVDPYRAATHNKGVMNGIDAVALATGNDWRGLEAGAHAYAARNGRYEPLTHWWRKDGFLHGRIELPMAVGTVGGSTEVQPTFKVLRKLLHAETSQELAMVMAAVGLAQNLGALCALAAEGIQRGHMSLHARSVALAAGVSEDRIDDVATALAQVGQFSTSAARRIATADGDCHDVADTQPTADE